MIARILALALFAVTAVVACSGVVASSPSGACTHDADCGAGRICGFKSSDGCNAAGTCFDETGGAKCNAIVPGCACDGTFVNLACNGYPNGVAGKPLLHTGVCAADASTAAPCSSTSDCATGQLCAFPINGGCQAQGTCFTPPPPGPTCGVYSPACTCGGQVINIACTNYPNGTASAPIRHTGTCGDDAGSHD